MEANLEKNEESQLKKVKIKKGGTNKALDMKDLLKRKDAKDKRKKDAKDKKKKDRQVKISQENQQKRKKVKVKSSKQDGKTVSEESTEITNVENTSQSQDVSSLSKSEKVFSKFKNVWITREIAARMNREVELKLTLRDIMHFAVFFIFVTIVCMHNISKSDFYLTRVIKQQFHTDNLEKMHSQEEFWNYLEDVFVDAIYWKTWRGSDQMNEAQENDNTIEILSENILMGAPRIKQVRVHNQSCKVHPYFSPRFESCYGEYNQANEDQKPFHLGVGTEWTYSSSIETGSPTSRGEFSAYGGGGYYTDLSKSKAKTRKLLKELKDNIWINRGTRCVTLHFTIYNGNLNLFSLVEFIFEFPPIGGVFTTNSITTVKVLRYITIKDYVILSCELLMYVYLVYFAMEEVWDLSVLKWKYFKEFWSIVEISIIVMGFLLLGIGLFRFSSVRSTLMEYKDNPRKYVNFEYIADLMVIYNNCAAALLFLTYIKIFKYISFNKTMSQLNITLTKCRKDVAGFAIMFMLVFIAFSALGYLLFGAEAESFNDFGYSMLTLLKTILGDFDYKELRRANPVFAPFFFILFIFLVFFVLLNMFLAIINDSYTEVKIEIAKSSPELQMSTILSRGCYNFCRKFCCKGLKKSKKKDKSDLDITLEEIKKVLKSCGFTDLEIEMFFQRYNIDPTVKIDEVNVNNILEELKGKYSRTQSDETNSQVVPLTDFVQQQKRLEKVERAVGKLSNTLESLLSKLKTLHSIRRVKMN